MTQIEQQFTDIMLVLCQGVLLIEFFLLFTTFDWSFEKKAVSNWETKPNGTAGDILESPVSTQCCVHVSRS